MLLDFKKTVITIDPQGASLEDQISFNQNEKDFVEN